MGVLYSYDLVLPASTAKTSPVTRDCAVAPGRLERVMVVFPPGCAKLAHLKIMHWSQQLYPSNEDGDLAGDAEVLDFPEDLDLTERPYMMRLVGWNEDDTYGHTLVVRFNVIRVPKIQGIPRWLWRALRGV